MSKPRVSIVMPVYNAGIYLKDAISDILCQTFTDFELICVDDGSTDGSLEVLKFFAGKDERIQIISQSNMGAGIARNMGLNASNGEFIIFLDADDRFSPGLIETMYKRAFETNAQIVVCDALQFNSESGEIYNPDDVGHILRNDITPDKDTFSYNDCPDDIYLFSAMTAWNKMYDLSFVREAGVQFQSVPYFNDAYFVVILMGMAERISTVSNQLIQYRLGNASSISWFVKKSEAPEYFFELFISMKDTLVKKGIFDATKKAFAKLVATNLCGHERIITEENYKIFGKYFDNGFVKNMCLDILERDEFLNDTEYVDISELVNHGELAFFARIIHRLVGEAEYYKTMPKVRKNLTDSKGVFFSISGVPDKSRIVIFGAGFRGREIYRTNSELNKYTVTGWLDSNAEHLGEIYGCIIKPPEQIIECDYDYVVIAVDKLSVMQEIREKLIALDVSENKIIW
ncbi:glycosyltransferase [Butyrivibrio sp. INlla14]|uniref:glycosyltransferase n=1 Tax=Butyrivibrio sp. INlla14 TaxID=1520808 RepID=UPI000876E87E|nr:glycosyltransferase [Butyrivibrio sp. INlla14]SCY71393.1 Glycosyltransferase involved in cell wall bisynthesis [Butyrivibrio sp. INlla14]